MLSAISYSFVKTRPDGKVFGMQVAILNFLRAYLQHTRQEVLPFLVRAPKSADEIRENAAMLGIDPKRLQIDCTPWGADVLDRYSSVFRVDPMPGTLLMDRAQMSTRGFAFCGLAHAIAGLEGGRILERYCLHPSAMGDAIICPSRAIQSAIRRFFDLYEEYLSQRFGVKYKCPVELPIIPLGIDLDRFSTVCTNEKRIQQRSKLGLDENDIVILWVGRLSAAVKAHPLAMFRAVNEAAKKSSKRVHFFMVGYFAPAEAEVEFRALARNFCPSASVRFFASSDPRFPDGLWAGADIFLSLVDNMQESFGLTPIEAIAANLPRVISDWDGYRDCVTHSEDGFLVPTTQPPEGQGLALATAGLVEDDLTYAQTLAKTALSVAVDYRAAAHYLLLLIEDATLRQKFAEAARKRLPNYAWRNIIPSYENLWNELASKRTHHKDL